MKIRKLKPKDISAAAKIVEQNYNKKYQNLVRHELKEMFSKALSKPVYFVAEENKKVVGFAGYIQAWMDYSIYQIFWVNVAPHLQRQGIGKQLVAKIISEIKKKSGVNLIQLTTNSPKYYSKHFGFKILQKFTDKYYLMTKKL